MGEDGVGLLVESENKFLLLKRKDTGVWEPCKGHIEPGETHDQTINRELLEETGIDKSSIHKKIGEITFSFISKKTNKQKTRTIHYYHVKVHGSNMNISDEHIDYVWLNKEDFLSRLEFEDIKDMMTKYLSR
ncbi:MAG: NUDIX domain-containing protein [Candidatus Woesearchaeota archaeon]